MASGDQFDYVNPQRLIPQNGQNAQVPRLISSGGLTGGVPLHKLGTEVYCFTTRVWTNGTPLPTGLTFGVELVDDPNNGNASGAVRLGITAKRLVSGTDDTTSAAAGAEQLFTATMPATSGILLRQSCAVANANLDSVAAGDTVLVQVRRVSTDAADTHTGTVLIAGISVRDT